MTEALERQMQFNLLPGDDGTPPLPVRVVLTYTRTDPYVISADFETGSRTTVRWIWGRDMVRAGLISRSGHGDVTFAPMPTEPGLINLILASPSGYASFTVPAAELGAFVAETYDLVAADTELSQVDMDGFLAALLDDSTAGGQV